MMDLSPLMPFLKERVRGYIAVARMLPEAQAVYSIPTGSDAGDTIGKSGPLLGIYRVLSPSKIRWNVKGAGRGITASPSGASVHCDPDCFGIKEVTFSIPTDGNKDALGYMGGITALWQDRSKAVAVRKELRSTTRAGDPFNSQNDKELIETLRTHFVASELLETRERLHTGMIGYAKGNVSMSDLVALLTPSDVAVIFRRTLAKRGVGIEQWIDTLEEAREGAMTPLGKPDHRVRMLAGKEEQILAGVYPGSIVNPGEGAGSGNAVGSSSVRLEGASLVMEDKDGKTISGADALAHAIKEAQAVQARLSGGVGQPINKEEVERIYKRLSMMSDGTSSVEGAE